MDDASIPAAGDDSPRAAHPDAGPGDLPDQRWAARQRLLAMIGTVVSLAGLTAIVVALLALPPGSGADGYATAAVIGGAVLLVCCGTLAWCWAVQLRDWRSGSEGRYALRVRIGLVAHLLSYLAVLTAMYATVAGSALAGWSSRSGTLFGVSFLLVICGQILGGTQLLRRSGPPGTVPNHLRRLNDKVQSLR